jgi:ABC-2 type transport system permease protein
VTAQASLWPTALLARRSVVGRFRHPSLFLPDVVGPLLFTSVLWGSFARANLLPGFPTVHSFLDFVVAGAVVVGVVFSATDVADDLGEDIRSGFFDRIAVSPTPRTAILLGRLAGAAVFAGFEALVIIAVLAAFGASVRGGVAAVAAVCVVAMVLALALGGLGANLALREGRAERTVALFVPFAFLLVFMSSAYFPRQAMDGWFRAVADWNPLSWIAEDLRHQTVTGFDLRTAGQALGMVTLLSALSVTSAVRAVRQRGRAR